jgi:hypothetical protein
VVPADLVGGAGVLTSRSEECIGMVGRLPSGRQIMIINII